MICFCWINSVEVFFCGSVLDCVVIWVLVKVYCVAGFCVLLGYFRLFAMFCGCLMLVAYLVVCWLDCIVIECLLMDLF